MANGNAQPNQNVGHYDSATVVPRSKQVRRINDDWEYLDSGKVSNNASNDEIFNASYKTRGLQPYGTLGKDKEQSTNDEFYDEDIEEGERGLISSRLSHAARAVAAKKAASLVTKVALKTRVSAVNTSIITWGSSLWFFVQLPFAILSLAMLGMMGVVNAFIQETGAIGSAAVWLAKKLAEGISLISGIDINLAAIADSLFIIPYILVLALGILTILIIYLQYSLSFLRPLSGEKAGLKLGALLFALICYSIPLLNLFPCALIWMAVVWKYPR